MKAVELMVWCTAGHVPTPNFGFDCAVNFTYAGRYQSLANNTTTIPPLQLSCLRPVRFTTLLALPLSTHIACSFWHSTHT